MARWAERACTAHGALEEVRGLVEHGERAVGIGHGVEAIRRAPADDADPVGLGQLVEVDAGEDRFEPLGFVASEVELGEQLHRPRPAAGGRGTAHEPFGDGVVAFEEGEACRVQHVLPVDRAAGVEPPGDEPDAIVAAARADRFERLGELATQPAPPERRQLAEEDLREQRVGERHPDAPPRVADGEQPVPLQILEHVVAGDGREGVEPDLACDREQLGRVVVGVVEAPKALGDETLERGGRLERADESPHAVELGQDAGLACGLHELAQHARVPHRCVSEAAERLGDDRPAEHAVQERLDALHRERLDGEAQEMPVLHEVVEGRRTAGRSHRDDGEHAARVHERGDEGTGQLVELVTVVDEQEQTLIPGLLAQRRRGPVEDGATVEVVRAGRGGDVDGQQVRQRRERDRATLGVTAHSGVRHAGRLGELEDPLREPRLADAGAAGEEHPAGGAVTEPPGEHLELAPAPDHRPRRGERPLDEPVRRLGG